MCARWFDKRRSVVSTASFVQCEIVLQTSGCRLFKPAAASAFSPIPLHRGSGDGATARAREGASPGRAGGDPRGAAVAETDRGRVGRSRREKGGGGFLFHPNCPGSVHPGGADACWKSVDPPTWLLKVCGFNDSTSEPIQGGRNRFQDVVLFKAQNAGLKVINTKPYVHLLAVNNTKRDKI